MVINIVAVGESAWDWYKTPCDYSIGVNDCGKWMAAVNELLIVNSPKMFPPERLETIKRTKFDKVKTNSHNWDKIFPPNIYPGNEVIRLQAFSKHLKKGHIYSSKSSPFVAMSLAFNMGATDIILHGVDMVNHKVFNPNNVQRSSEGRMFDYEVRQIQNFTRMMADQGTKTWLSKDYGALTKILNVWQPKKEYSLTVDRIGLNQDDVDKLTDAFDL